jgi:hypothetical protein
MQIENRLNYIRSFFESHKFAEQGLIPITERDEQEACAELGTFINQENRAEEEEVGAPSPELRAVFGEFE